MRDRLHLLPAQRAGAQVRRDGVDLADALKVFRQACSPRMTGPLLLRRLVRVHVPARPVLLFRRGRFLDHRYQNPEGEQQLGLDPAERLRLRSSAPHVGQAPGQLRVEVAHSCDERDDRHHELDEPQRLDHLLQPLPNIVDVRHLGGSDRRWLAHSAESKCANAPIAVNKKMIGREDVSSDGSTWLPPRSPTCARQVDPFYDQRQLCCLDRLWCESSVCRERGAKPAHLQTLRPHRKSVSIPINQTYPVTSLRKEDEQVPTQRILSEQVAHDHHQAVRPLPPVDWLRGHKESDTRRQAQHAATGTSSTATTRRSTSSPNPSFRRMT